MLDSAEVGLTPKPEAAPVRQWRPHALVGFLAAVLVLKLTIVWQLKDHVLLQADAGLDTSAYLSLAARVDGGDLLLGPGLYFVSPLYIYFLALVLAVTKSVAAIRVLQVTLGTGTVALVWWMGDRWLGKRGAWMAGALAAGTGLFTFYETLVLQAALDPFLVACALAALTAALTGAGRWSFVAAGVAFGVQAQNRPNVLLAAAGLWLLLAMSRRWRGALLMLAGMLAALAPVTLRNGAVAGEWSPVSSHGGLNFYIGNNAEADGTYHAVPGITPSIAGQQEDARRVAGLALARPVDDAEASSHFYDLARSWIRQEPAAAVRLLARKLLYVVHASHLSLNFSYPFYARDSGSVLGMLVVGPWLLMPLGLVGLAWLSWGRRSSGFPIWAAFVPLYVVSVALFLVAERYRLPLLVPLCLASAATIDAMVGLARAGRLRALAALVVPCAALAAVVNWPLGLDDARAEERTRMTERLITLGRFDEAGAWAARAEAIQPTLGLMHFRIGRAYLAANKVDDAVVQLRRAKEIEPGRPEIDFALGQALLQAGRAAEAVPLLRQAYDKDVRPDLSGFDLSRALAAIGDRAGAVGILERVRPGRVDDADSWFAIGQLAIDLQAPQLAQDCFVQAVKARPAFAAAKRQLGLAYGLAGRPADAARELEQAIALAPADAAAHLNLAVVSAQLGHVADARAHAAEAIRLQPGYERARQLLELLTQQAPP